MSAAILPFVHPLWIAQDRKAPELVFTAIDGYAGSYLLDNDLGTLLGFRDPLAAINELQTRHRSSLLAHMVTVDRYSPDEHGRTQVVAFDLEGALALCRLGITDTNVARAMSLAAQIGREIAMNAMLAELDEQTAQIIPFPRRASQEVSHG